MTTSEDNKRVAMTTSEDERRLAMTTSEDERRVLNELRSGKYELELCDFERVWYQYDINRKGFIEKEDVAEYVRDILAYVTIPALSPFQETVSNVLNRSFKTNFHIHDISVLLPLSGDVYARFYEMRTGSGCTSSVDFMKLWRECDSDGNGYLDRVETANLVRRIFAINQRKLEKKYGLAPKMFSIDHSIMNRFIAKVFETADLNKDGMIQLRELALMLNVERNFLDMDPSNLQQKKLGEIFGHYDKDDSGQIEGAEFLAFVRDVLRVDNKPLSRGYRKNSDVNADELELAGDLIMGLVDDDDNGKLDRSEIGAVFGDKPEPPKLLKNSSMFLNMQSSFSRGEN